MPADQSDWSTVSFDNITASNNITNGGWDFAIGTTDQITRGNTNDSRAMIKNFGGKLAINYNRDFDGGVEMFGSMDMITHGGHNPTLRIDDELVLNKDVALDSLNINQDGDFTYISMRSDVRMWNDDDLYLQDGNLVVNAPGAILFGGISGDAFYYQASINSSFTSEDLKGPANPYTISAPSMDVTDDGKIARVQFDFRIVVGAVGDVVLEMTFPGGFPSMAGVQFASGGWIVQDIAATDEYFSGIVYVYSGNKIRLGTGLSMDVTATNGDHAFGKENSYDVRGTFMYSIA